MDKKLLKKYLKEFTSGKRTYIWGASSFLKKIFKELNSKDYNIIGIIDKDSTKEGKHFCGYQIFGANRVKELKPERIINAAKNYPYLSQQIKKDLEEIGINCEVFSLDYFVKKSTPVRLNPILFFLKSNKEKLNYIVEESKKLYYYDSAIRSMLRPDEKRILHMLAKYYYSGRGAIFDAGIFLGGCTEAFCNGLNENKRVKPNNQIWAYEYGNCSPDVNFEVDGAYTFEFLQNSYPNKKINYDFTNIVRENLEGLNKPSCYQLYLGDINVQPYPNKIEIMFLDVCKCSRTNFAMQKLFSRLIPNKSVVIQQDYIFSACPWLRITMGYLKDYFEFIGATKVNSALFLLKKEIPAEILNVDPYEKFDYEKLVELHNYYNQYLNQEQSDMIVKAVEFIKRDKNICE